MKKLSSCRVVGSKNIRVTEILGIAGYFLLYALSIARKSREGRSVGQDIITRLLSALQDPKLHRAAVRAEN
jgi:hypothetical protein